MDFNKITDALFARVDHADLAKELGVSVALIRQARLASTATAHRTPPKGWERAALRLADERAQHYRRLADKLRGAVKP